MALVVVDASVVIAQLDPADALHARARRALEDDADHELVLPATAYAEALVRPAARGRIDEARQAITALEFRIEPIGPAIAERAAALRGGFPSLRLPDALVIAAADTLAADRLLTGDARWPAVSARAAVI